MRQAAHLRPEIIPEFSSCTLGPMVLLIKNVIKSFSTFPAQDEPNAGLIFKRRWLSRYGGIRIDWKKDLVGGNAMTGTAEQGNVARQ